MRFFIVDDDEAIRFMLSEIIEDNDLGCVAGWGENGAAVSTALLQQKQIDILVIDLLMPVMDGLQAIRSLTGFTGKIIMLSQIEDKSMIGQAYVLGIDHYITKPVNRLEVISVIQKVSEHLRLQKTIATIEQHLTGLHIGKAAVPDTQQPAGDRLAAGGQHLLAELGMIDAAGSSDLLIILTVLSSKQLQPADFPPLKDLLLAAARQRITPDASEAAVHKEAKALEQRIRRAIFQSLLHLASLGITDYTNPKFEEYAPRFFEFSEIRKAMQSLQKDCRPSISDTRINIKKFVKVLFLEAMNQGPRNRGL